MSKKSQRKLGLKYGRDFSWTEREMIIKDYLSCRQTKRAIWEKYSGQTEEHGQLLTWMRKLGYVETDEESRPKNKVKMDREKSDNSVNEFEHFELLQLKKRVAELEQELQESKMKAIAYSTMVDIAEQEYKIKIRKKYTTKPSK